MSRLWIFDATEMWKIRRVQVVHEVQVVERRDAGGACSIVLWPRQYLCQVAGTVVVWVTSEETAPRCLSALRF